MRNVFKIKNSTIVYLIVLLPIFIDQLNGFLVHEFSITISISQFVKALYLLLFLLTIMIFDRRGYIRIFTLFYIIVILLPLIIANNYLLSRYSDLYGDIVFSTKLLMFPLTYFAFIYIIAKRPIFNTLYLNKLYVILFVTVCIAMMLSLGGYGISNYGVAEGGVSYGFRGYFIAGNEISALYILLYSLFLYYALYIRKQFLVILTALILGGVTALLMVTKTVLAGYVLVSIGVPILLTYYEKGNLFFFPSMYMKKFYIALVILFSVSVSLGAVLFWDRVSVNLDRMSYNLAKAGNVVGFILSGRDARFEPVLSFYYDKYSIIEMLFGTGWNHFQYANGRNGVALTAEMDFIDLLLSNGIVGLMVIYGFWVYLLIKIFGILRKRKSALSIPLFIASVLLFTNSFFSGHILYSAMLTFYLGFFVAVLIVSVSKQQKDDLYNYSISK